MQVSDPRTSPPNPFRMRPLTLPERGVETSAVSLAAMLDGEHPDVDGATTVRLEA